MKRVDFVNNTLFKSYGNICWSSRPTSLSDELSMYKGYSDSFFSTTVVCRFSDTTDLDEESTTKQNHLQDFEISKILNSLRFQVRFQDLKISNKISVFRYM